MSNESPPTSEPAEAPTTRPQTEEEEGEYNTLVITLVVLCLLALVILGVVGYLYGRNVLNALADTVVAVGVAVVAVVDLSTKFILDLGSLLAHVFDFLTMVATQLVFQLGIVGTAIYNAILTLKTAVLLVVNAFSGGFNAIVASIFTNTVVFWQNAINEITFIVNNAIDAIILAINSF